MRIEKDFEDLLGCLNRNKVKYCIVGGFAVIYYTAPRYTGDMDILVKPVRENAKKIISALEEFGVGSGELSEEDLVCEGKIIEIGRPPIMVHIMTRIDGVKSPGIWKRLATAKYGKEPVYFIGLDELKKNKKACSLKTGRKSNGQDKLDLKMLQKLKRG